MSNRLNNLLLLFKGRAEALLAGKFWWLPLLAVVGALQITATVRALLRKYPLAIGVDAAYFQHAGGYILQGARPYINIWEPSPPLSFYITAVLAFLSGENVFTLHIVSMILTGILAISIALLVAVLTVELTGKQFAGLFAGLMLYTFVNFYILPTLGFGYKYVMLFFALLGLWLAMRRRPFLSGIALVASAATWFPAIFFVGLGLGLNWYRTGGRGLLKAVAGALLALTIILLPILYWDGLGPMFNQVVLAQLSIREEQSLLLRLEKGAYFLRLTALYVAIGALGIVRALTNREWKVWWVAVASGWFTIQVLLLDFDNFPDLYTIVAFTAIGFGVFVAKATVRARTVLAFLLILTILVAPVISFQVRRNNPEDTRPKTMLLANGDTVPTLQTMYWEKMRPTTCYYRASPVHQRAQMLWGEQSGTCRLLDNEADVRK